MTSDCNFVHLLHCVLLGVQRSVFSPLPVLTPVWYARWLNFLLLPLIAPLALLCQRSRTSAFFSFLPRLFSRFSFPSICSQFLLLLLLLVFSSCFPFQVCLLNFKTESSSANPKIPEPGFLNYVSSSDFSEILDDDFNAINSLSFLRILRTFLLIFSKLFKNFKNGPELSGRNFAKIET